MRYDDDDDGGPRNGGAEIAGLDSDGVDFTEMSSAAALLSCSSIFLKGIVQHFDDALKWLIQIYFRSCCICKPNA